MSHFLARRILRSQAAREASLVYDARAAIDVGNTRSRTIRLLHFSVSAAKPNTRQSFGRVGHERKTNSLSAISYSFRRWATSTTDHSSPVDPAETEAIKYLQLGTQKLEEGDVEGAKAMYKRSVEIKRDAGSLFNLGVTHYHLKEFDEAIESWKESISLQPSSPDAHTNLASAYIISANPRPDLALHHLNIASSLSPEDPEIAFNLAAVLEACGRLEEALTHYQRSKKFGVERAALHIRNVSAKILGKRMKEAQEKSNPK